MSLTAHRNPKRNETQYQEQSILISGKINFFIFIAFCYLKSEISECTELSRSSLSISEVMFAAVLRNSCLKQTKNVLPFFVICSDF